MEKYTQIKKLCAEVDKLASLGLYKQADTKVAEALKLGMTARDFTTNVSTDSIKALKKWSRSSA